MDSSNQLSSFQQAVQGFRDCILRIPDNLFLAPMNGWAPRDVIAHLIAWNEEMLKVCMGIQRGETPAYYADAPNDYSNINAKFIARYNSQEKPTLLHQLDETTVELVNYLLSLPAEEWEADHGILHHQGSPATISQTIESLAGDYRHHTQEILEWRERQL